MAMSKSVDDLRYEQLRHTHTFENEESRAGCDVCLLLFRLAAEDCWKRKGSEVSGRIAKASPVSDKLAASVEARCPSDWHDNHRPESKCPKCGERCDSLMIRCPTANV